MFLTDAIPASKRFLVWLRSCHSREGACVTEVRSPLLQSLEAAVPVTGLAGGHCQFGASVASHLETEVLSKDTFK